MHASTEARLQRLQRAAAHDDDFEWSSLRARAEQTWQHHHAADQGVVCDEESATSSPDSEWEWLRIRAELAYAASRYTLDVPRALPPPLPRRHPSLRSFDVAAPATMLFDTLESDLLEWVPRRRHPWPVLLSVLICTALVGTAFVRQRVAEAEQQARIEQALAEIRASHDQDRVGSATHASTLTVASPQAEPPKSETLAAFMRMSAATMPGSLAKAPARRVPVRAALVRRHAPTRRIATAVHGLPSQSVEVPTLRRAEPEEEGSTSDDPLFGL